MFINKNDNTTVVYGDVSFGTLGITATNANLYTVTFTESGLGSTTKAYGYVAPSSSGWASLAAMTTANDASTATIAISILQLDGTVDASNMIQN